MSIARARALTHVVILQDRSNLAVVEMSIARARALTQNAHQCRKLVFIGRNEYCPCEGIDTSGCLNMSTFPPVVEMSIARARALTLVGHLVLAGNDMSRNEYCPCEGIDTRQAQ